MTKYQSPTSFGGGLLTYFPTSIPESKTDKISFFVWGGVIDPTFVAKSEADKMTKLHISGGGGFFQSFVTDLQ